MTDPPPLLMRPKRLSLIPQQPTRNRFNDDLFAHLHPSTVVEALTTTTGALGHYLAGTSAAERDFAIRAAVASQRVWEWVDELSDWEWPVDVGSAGFESPNHTTRRLPFQIRVPQTCGAEYMGSLPAREVALYARRIEEILRDMDDLEVEEIKSQVLNNYIMPLSRPCTPLSISSRGPSSVSVYTKMEDVSALVTTILVQTLPNLTKLTRLLRTWTVRLGVLQRIPPLLYAIEDAEVGLKAGWAAILKPAQSLPTREHGKRAMGKKPTLKRTDFEIMRKVLVKKVSTPGRMLDIMLDSLEGMDDTLPDSWLDRLEAVEQNYSEWVAACERKIRESAWYRSAKPPQSLEQPAGEDAGEPLQSEPSAEYSEPLPGDPGIAIALPVPLKEKRGNPSLTDDGPSTSPSDCDDSPTRANDDPPDKTSPVPPRDAETRGPRTPTHEVFSESELATESFDAVELSPPSDHDVSGLTRTMSPVGEVEEEDDEDLPLLHSSAWRGSDLSDDSILLPGDTSRFDVLSSDLPEMSASPPVPRNRVREARFADDSPPSSPPLPRESSEESPNSCAESPSVTPAAEGFGLIYDHKTVTEGSFAEDFDDLMSPSEAAGPSFRRDSTSDRQLRQQISNIIESIPAKIKLSAEPSPIINLNPPDLQLPRLGNKPSKEPFKQSTSSLSSRTATPSFTLSPARTNRPRQFRGQQEIKVYHLSRSTGEAPIKLFIRCVGEHGERVMVRVGGGWADLSEYLKAYASHHGRRSVGAERAATVEVQDAPRSFNTSAMTATGSSPPSRPVSAAAAVRMEHSPITQLNIRKTRRSSGAGNSEVPRLRARKPGAPNPRFDVSCAEDGEPSRPNSRLSWVEDDSSFLGLAGPKGKKVEMSEENKAWVESVKERVRQVSGERRVSQPDDRKRFGELGKVGGTKRLFLKAADNAPKARSDG